MYTIYLLNKFFSTLRHKEKDLIFRIVFISFSYYYM